jgi:hypothetical protein
MDYKYFFARNLNITKNTLTKVDYHILRLNNVEKVNKNAHKDEL